MPYFQMSYGGGGEGGWGGGYGGGYGASGGGYGGGGGGYAGGGGPPSGYQAPPLPGGHKADMALGQGAARGGGGYSRGARGGGYDQGYDQGYGGGGYDQGYGGGGGYGGGRGGYGGGGRGRGGPGGTSSFAAYQTNNKRKYEGGGQGGGQGHEEKRAKKENVNKPREGREPPLNIHIDQSFNYWNLPVKARVLLVSNVPQAIAMPDLLYNLFSFYGDVERVKVLRKAGTCALVEFTTATMAAIARDHLDGVEVRGVALAVSFSRFDRVRLPAEAGFPADNMTKDFSGPEYQKFRRYQASTAN